jgi:hypothetical protein
MAQLRQFEIQALQGEVTKALQAKLDTAIEAYKTSDDYAVKLSRLLTSPAIGAAIEMVFTQREIEKLKKKIASLKVIADNFTPWTYQNVNINNDEQADKHVKEIHQRAEDYLLGEAIPKLPHEGVITTQIVLKGLDGDVADLIASLVEHFANGDY